jgi:hypothetical protein
LALVCAACGKEREMGSNGMPTAKTWMCKFCTLENLDLLDNCEACNQWRFSHGAPVASRGPYVGTWERESPSCWPGAEWIWVCLIRFHFLFNIQFLIDVFFGALLPFASFAVTHSPLYIRNIRSRMDAFGHGIAHEFPTLHLCCIRNQFENLQNMCRPEGPLSRKFSFTS